MPSSRRSDSAWQDLARNIVMRLAPEYPPPKGDPPSPAALDTIITTEPGASGIRSASRQKRNAILVSTSQFSVNSSQLSPGIRRIGGIAPPQTTSTSGFIFLKASPGADSDAALSARQSNFRSPLVAGSCQVLATARTCAPAPDI